LAAELQSLCGGAGGREVDEAIARITTNMSSETLRRFAASSQNLPGEFIPNHLDADLLTHLKPKVTNKVLIDPRFKLTHPVESVRQRDQCWRERSKLTYQRVVFCSPPGPA